MSLLIAIDPGKNTGWAVFEKPIQVPPYHLGVLVSANVGFWAEVFENTQDFLHNISKSVSVYEIEVLGELPCVYPGPRPEDPNDLIVLAEQLGELLSLYRARGCVVSTVAPRTWKGTVPKRYHQPRILSKLTREELALVPKMPQAGRYENNAVDAVGLGLWKLGRMHG